jgi:hypothetical protein
MQERLLACIGRGLDDIAQLVHQIILTPHCTTIDSNTGADGRRRNGQIVFEIVSTMLQDIVIILGLSGK